MYFIAKISRKQVERQQIYTTFLASVMGAYEANFKIGSKCNRIFVMSTVFRRIYLDVVLNKMYENDLKYKK